MQTRGLFKIGETATTKQGYVNVPVRLKGKAKRVVERAKRRKNGSPNNGGQKEAA